MTPKAYMEETAGTRAVIVDLARELLAKLETGADTTRTRGVLKVALRELDAAHDRLP